VTGIIILSGGMHVISWSLAGAVTVFAGGLVAGLLTRGSGWDGSIAGAPSGIIVAAGTAIRSFTDPLTAAGDWRGIATSMVFTAVLFVLSNAVSGVTGSVARSVGEWLTFPPGIPEEAARSAARRLWAGIITGALFIPCSVFATGSLSYLLIIPPFAGGMIAGLCTPEGIRIGAGAGFLTGIIGIGILAIPVIWIGSRETGFVAGLGWIVLMVMSFFSLPAATAGGIIGGYLIGIFRRPSPDQRPGQ
jgi:hypothetical protein